MKVPEPENEDPVAWNAMLLDTPVYSADGEEVGAVHEALGAEDIFHGIVVRSGLLSHQIMIPAAQVTRITNRRVDTSVTAEQIRDLPPYQEEESYQLGIVGILRRHLGWVPDRGEEE